MIKYVRRSLRNKLIAAFLLIGFLPVILFFVYMVFLSQNKIVQKSIAEEYEQIERLEQIIGMHLYQIHKEVIFLSRLDVMDDIVTEDLDKRITRLLEQKAKDLSLDVTLYVVDTKRRLIAASKQNAAANFFPNDTEEGFYHNAKRLYFFSEIRASYDRNTRLGYLVLEYNLDNLELFLNTTEHIHAFLLDPRHKLTIARAIDVSLEKATQSSLITDEHLIVFKALGEFLQGWYIVYAVDKSVALAFLYDFLRFMLYLIPLGIVIVLFIALKFARTIVSPIEKLTALSEHITQTKDFSKTIEITSEDEIATLSRSFNLMLAMTDKALKELEKENKLRLQRFIHLIQIFHAIMQTQDTQECLDVSLEKLKELTQDDALSITTDPVYDENAIKLYVIDYESDKKEYFGAIILDKKHLNDINERRFFESIAQMISLQLDRILLIDKTMAASRAKSAFISNMSHELRTPLNAIIGFTQYLLAYEELNDEQNEIIGNIESSAQYLLSMINDILDMAKIEAGKMEAHIETFAPRTLCEEVAAMVEPLADEKGIELIRDFSVDTTLTIQSDPKMFKQITLNLLSNAIKFTQEGYVRFCLSQENDTILIRIQDTGIGISAENLQKLFSDFTQVENVMQKKHKGTGLGLSLSKKMARLLKGDITLTSPGEGKGSEATFWLPITSYQS